MFGLLRLPIRFAFRLALGALFFLLLPGFFAQTVAFGLAFGFQPSLLGLSLRLQTRPLFFARLFLGFTLDSPLFFESRLFLLGHLLGGLALAGFFLGFALALFFGAFPGFRLLGLRFLALFQRPDAFFFLLSLELRAFFFLLGLELRALLLFLRFGGFALFQRFLALSLLFLPGFGGFALLERLEPLTLLFGGDLVSLPLFLGGCLGALLFLLLPELVFLFLSFEPLALLGSPLTVFLRGATLSLLTRGDIGLGRP